MASEVEIHEIKNNPGLLPHKLGTAKIKTNTWTLVKNINLKEILSEYESLCDAATKLNQSFYEKKAEKWYIKEMHNFQYIITHLRQEIDSLIEQVIPKHAIGKRGIINGLGTAIKFVTGNMDQEDAEKINNQLRQLQESQKGNAEVLKENISLTKHAISSFNKTIANLKHNQHIFQSRITQIGKIITESKKYEESRYDYVTLCIVYSQLTNSLMMIVRILSDIRSSLVFARLNTMHPSIIEPHLLLQDLSSITDNQSTLPIKPSMDNIIIIESLINIKAYQHGTNIVFILEVPLVSKTVYNFYHLYSLPIKNKTIIPSTYYMLNNEQYYSNLNEKCKEILPYEFLCKTVNLMPINDDSSCEVQIVTLSTNYKNCKQIPVILGDIKIQEIENNYWIIVLNNQTKMSISCSANQYIKQIKNTNIIHIPSNCFVTINGIIIKNSYKVRNSMYKLFNFEYDIEIKSSSTETVLNPINLKSIDLEKTKDLINQLDNLEKNVKDIKFNNKNPSIWTIILYCIILIICIYVIVRLIMNKKNKKTNCFKIERQNTCNSQNLTDSQCKF